MYVCLFEREIKQRERLGYITVFVPRSFSIATLFAIK